MYWSIMFAFVSSSTFSIATWSWYWPLSDCEACEGRVDEDDEESNYKKYAMRSLIRSVFKNIQNIQKTPTKMSGAVKNFDERAA